MAENEARGLRRSDEREGGRPVAPPEIATFELDGFAGASPQTAGAGQTGMVVTTSGWNVIEGETDL